MSIFKCVTHEFSTQEFDPSNHVSATLALQQIVGHVVENEILRQKILSTGELLQLKATLAFAMGNTIEKGETPGPFPKPCFVTSTPSESAT